MRRVQSKEFFIVSEKGQNHRNDCQYLCISPPHLFKQLLFVARGTLFLSQKINSPREATRVIRNPLEVCTNRDQEHSN